MAIRSVTGQTAAKAEPEMLGSGPEKPAGGATSDMSQAKTGQKKMVATFLNPGCAHDWFKLANHLQTLVSDGKTIWQCRTCSEITNTYDWQTP